MKNLHQYISLGIHLKLIFKREFGGIKCSSFRIKVCATIDCCQICYVFFSENALFLFRFEVLAPTDTLFIMKRTLPELSRISSDFAFRIYKFNDTFLPQVIIIKNISKTIKN